MERFKNDIADSNLDVSMFDFWIECVRQGRVDIIRDHYSEEEKRQMCDQMFRGDRAYALRVCVVLWTEAVKIAESVHLPNSVVDKTFEECVSRSHEASTPYLLMKLSEEYLAEFAGMIDESVLNSGSSPVFVKFQKYIKAHICDPLSIKDIASALNISESHLSHTIKKETGETVHRWIVKEKVDFAKIMLSKNTYCMNEIWVSLGFCSQSHFAKCFREITGMTPSKFNRESHMFDSGGVKRRN